MNYSEALAIYQMVCQNGPTWWTEEIKKRGMINTLDNFYKVAIENKDRFKSDFGMLEVGEPALEVPLGFVMDCNPYTKEVVEKGLI